MMQLAQLAQWAGGELRGADAPVSAVRTDSRMLEAGDLFVALPGVRVDGHDFVVVCTHAAGVLVERAVEAPCVQIRVPDTVRALQDIAHQWRRECAPRVTAITGSNGKTSTKEMTAAILSHQGETLASQGNFNNHLGVPLTLLELTPEHRYAVIEMGANHAGEIRLLASLAEPQVATITCVAEAHLEGFGSLDGVADAKGEIFEGLPSGGVAVINAEDPYAPRWRARIPVPDIFSFSADPAIEADVHACIPQDGTLQLRHGAREWTVDWHLEGIHNARNAACAVAQALALHVDFDAAVEALSGFELSAGGRLRTLRGVAGARLIDDSYNANPGSFRAAIDVLVSDAKEPWLVMGEMAELGEYAERCHQEVAAYARDAGIRRLYVLGRYARACAKEFGANGQAFEDLEHLAEELRGQMHPGCTVLVKASRSGRLERLVERLQAEETSHAA